MAGTYTTRCKTRRWNMNLLAYVLDTARTNASSIWRMKGYKITSYDFIWQLGESMIKPYIQYRRDNARYLRRNITSAMQKIVPQDKQNVERAGAERGRCHLCPESIQGKGYKAKRQKLSKHTFSCNACGKTVCPTHLAATCNVCQDE